MGSRCPPGMLVNRTGGEKYAGGDDCYDRVRDRDPAAQDKEPDKGEGFHVASASQRWHLQSGYSVSRCLMRHGLQRRFPSPAMVWNNTVVATGTWGASTM